MRDELVAQNAMKEYLADMGVEVSSDLAEFNTNKSGYVKVDKKLLAVLIQFCSNFR